MSIMPEYLLDTYPGLTNFFSINSAICPGVGGTSPTFIKAACAESTTAQYRSSVACKICQSALCMVAGALAKYVQMLSFVGLILPWKSSCCTGSKNPASYKGTPSRSIFIAIGSPFLV